jgi:hypothetical protein
MTANQNGSYSSVYSWDGFMFTDELTKNCNRESGSLRWTVKLYRQETGRPDEGYAKYEENEEELERVRIKVKEKSYEKKRKMNG